MSSRPLSRPEIRAWISSAASPRPAEQNMVQAYRLPRPVDVDTLRRNTAALLVNHPTLRTAYTLGPDGDLVATALAPTAAPPVRVLAADGEEQAAALVAEHAGEEFDLATPPLVRVLAIRVGADRHWVAVVVHHIAADGDSFAPIWADLLDRPGPPAPGYRTHVEELLRERASDAYAEHLAFWRAGAGELGATLRSMAASGTDDGAPDGASFDVPTADWHGVVELARAEGVTPFTVVVAALARAVGRLLGLDRVAIGVAVSTRTPGPAQARVVGNFLNIVPIVFPGADAGVGEVGDRLFEALAHATVPLEEILSLAAGDARDFHRQPVSVTATGFAAAGPLDTAAGPAEPALVDQGASKTALSLYLEIHRRHATVHLAGGVDFRLLPARSVVGEIRRELAASPR
ncbi:condensation domain-containing protein [Micromonospora sp. WMMD882]|uniref:condensation domain-containing protein n=1 Tax=Micromonospora sp. WMMD882 TaxID=3015151 RepID=UPI00248B03FE|nr:condensation domain-containing protein [Micromonospora sp. WMMD882]WBB78076.1 condensation domain-containing protein [Micromonospora sp. WMMD882]